MCNKDSFSKLILLLCYYQRAHKKGGRFNKKMVFVLCSLNAKYSYVIEKPKIALSKMQNWCVMSQSSLMRDVIWLHAMNFIIVGNTWGYHLPIVSFVDDVICKRDIYMSIQEKKLFLKHVTIRD